MSEQASGLLAKLIDLLSWVIIEIRDRDGIYILSGFVT